MKTNFLSLISILIAFSCGSPENERFFTKRIDFPEDASLEQKVKMAAKLVPTSQQLEWQKMELTAFLHFGINTFTGKEWGDGNENPALFNPSDFDAEQWIKVLKESGFKMVILTAKHHDGFCLWPTKSTSHSVAASPWKEGKGDVVKEVKEACDKFGMKFGFYLSPWDRHAECYGDSPRYDEYFITQLTELLTGYGGIHEVWLDGANGEGPNGKKQIYDWDAYYATIRQYQPKAVTAIMGDDVRWVGNEKGLGRQTEWSATVLMPKAYKEGAEYNSGLGIEETSSDLGSRNVLKKAKSLFWYPSEVDVSIRPGWFYHKEEDEQVKSLKKLIDIYFESVGYNSVLLLNIPPDRRGLIHNNDVKRLQEFSSYLKELFSENRISSGTGSWKGYAGYTKTFTLKNKGPVNVLMLMEDIERGQRVEGFSIEIPDEEGEWKTIFSGTTIGYKRLIRLPDTRAKIIRVRIDSCRLPANIKTIGAYYAKPIAE